MPPKPFFLLGSSRCLFAPDKNTPFSWPSFFIPISSTPEANESAFVSRQWTVKVSPCAPAMIFFLATKERDAVCGCFAVARPENAGAAPVHCGADKLLTDIVIDVSHVRTPLLLGGTLILTTQFDDSILKLGGREIRITCLVKGVAMMFDKKLNYSSLPSMCGDPKGRKRFS